MRLLFIAQMCIPTLDPSVAAVTQKDDCTGGPLSGAKWTHIQAPGPVFQFASVCARTFSFSVPSAESPDVYLKATPTRVEK